MEHWTELNGKHYADLPPLVQRGIDRRRISAVVLQANSPSADTEELRRIVFERLNTGGQKLNAQELRNCLYSSGFSSLLVTLAGYRIFNDLWEIPRYEDHISGGHASQVLAENPLYKRMVDCELVLRFFAFREKKNIKGSVKSIMDKCMQTNRSLDAKELADLAQIFRSRIDLAHEIFGVAAFKIRDTEKGKEKTSQPFYDAIVIACDRQFDNGQKLISKKTALRKLIGKALGNQENYELIVGRANTAEAIKNRLDLVESYFIQMI